MARDALRAPREQTDVVQYYVLAANSSATTSAITGASDATIQTNVDDAVDKLFGVS